MTQTEDTVNGSSHLFATPLHVMAHDFAVHALSRKGFISGKRWEIDASSDESQGS